MFGRKRQYEASPQSQEQIPAGYRRPSPEEVAMISALYQEQAYPQRVEPQQTPARMSFVPERRSFRDDSRVIRRSIMGRSAVDAAFTGSDLQALRTKTGETPAVAKELVDIPTDLLMQMQQEGLSLENFGIPSDPTPAVPSVTSLSPQPTSTEMSGQVSAATESRRPSSQASAIFITGSDTQILRIAQGLRGEA